MALVARQDAGSARFRERRRRGCPVCLLLFVPLCAALAAPRTAAQTRPTELSGYLTIASDMRRHGLSAVGGDAALEIGFDYAHTSGAFFGAAAHNVSFATRPGGGYEREAALDVYAGRMFDRGDWRMSVSVGHYRYPGARYDYDYTALNGIVSYRGRIHYRLSAARDYLSLDVSMRDHELGTTVPIAAGFELDAAIGRFEPNGDVLPAYTHFDIGVSRLVAGFATDIRYYGTSRDLDTRAGTTLGERWVLSLSYAIRRR